MTLEGRHIWLTTRGGERAPVYQSLLVAALEEAGAETVEVVGVEGLVRGAAADLGERAGEWLESTAGRLARGLRIDRLLGLGQDDDDEGAPEDATTPDLVVVDDPRLLKTLRVTPRYRRAAPLTVALVDDFAVDTSWRGAAVDAVIAPHEALARAYSSGEGGPQVVVAGPPVDPGLAGDQSVDAAKTALGLPVEQPVVIVAAQRYRLDLLDRTVFQLTLLDVTPTVLFHYGGSRERAQVLRDAAGDYGLRAQMFGNVDRLATIFAAADLILAPADDPAVIELLLAQRPVVLVGPDRGSARAAFLADQGAALHVEDVVELGTHLDTLLSADVGRGMVEAARSIVVPDGCQRIAAALGELWAAHELRQAQAPEPEPPTPEPPAPAPEAPLVKTQPGAAFESIGATRSAASGSIDPPITAAEAKDQMASLIIKEREAQRTMGEAVKNRDRWLGRLELAKDYKDQDLIEVAGEKLRLASAQVARLNGQIETIRRSKAKLKARVERSRPAGGSRPAPGDQARPDSTSGAGSAIESRFRKMEIDRDLTRLRRRLDDD